MPLQKCKAVTNGLRHKTKNVQPHLSKTGPSRQAKHLLVPLNRKGGRNSDGRVTNRNIGGGHKRHYRLIDFKRRGKDGILATVESLEYDPNRTSHIALLKYIDGERRYIIAPASLKVGNKVYNGAEAEITPGNAMPMRAIPDGTLVYCIELQPGKGAELVRSAGTAARILSREGDYALIKLPSGEMRQVPLNCWATIGAVSNSEHMLEKLGKAGATRHRGRRPKSRAVAKNPVDHPLGGGEGRTSGGRPSCSPNGIPKGRKTRSRKKASNRLIVRSRKKGDKK